MTIEQNTEMQSGEDTLRLVAALPAPAGMEERIQQRLKLQGADRVIEWPVKPRAGQTWLRGAAAAALVCVVVGGGWSLYQHVRPADAARMPAISAPATQGAFASAGAKRTPLTLVGPKAPKELKKQKLSASPAR